MSLQLEKLLNEFYQQAHIMIHGYMNLTKRMKDMEEDIERTLNAHRSATDILEQIKKEVDYGSR